MQATHRVAFDATKLQALRSTPFLVCVLVRRSSTLSTCLPMDPWPAVLRPGTRSLRAAALFRSVDPCFDVLLRRHGGSRKHNLTERGRIMNSSAHVTSNNVNGATVPFASPRPTKKHIVKVAKHVLARHGIHSPAFITSDALDLVDIDDALAWFDGPQETILVGESREIGHGLQALFGYDGSKPNGMCFYVLISVAQ